MNLTDGLFMFDYVENDLNISSSLQQSVLNYWSMWESRHLLFYYVIVILNMG